MDDRQKRPDTELLDLSVHPYNHDMPYTYQATNDQPHEHPYHEPRQWLATQLVWVVVSQIAGEHDSAGETQ